MCLLKRAPACPVELEQVSLNVFHENNDVWNDCDAIKRKKGIWECLVGAFYGFIN